LGKSNPRPPPQRAYAQLASFFSAVLGQGIEEKRPALAGLLRAMMLGATRELSEEQHALFMQSGTMHLFAISGLNIGVIAGALQALLLLVRLPVWPRFLFGTALLWIFVETTGASASAVRAFAMAVFVQAALVLRQPANVLAALVLSAFVVLLVSPLQVFSASFLMSYTIVMALLTLGLPLSDAWLDRWSPWRELPRPAWRPWQRLVANGWRLTVPSLAVGLATMPVSLLTGVQYFQLLTPGSLLTNLLLIPRRDARHGRRVRVARLRVDRVPRRGDRVQSRRRARALADRARRPPQRRMAWRLRAGAFCHRLGRPRFARHPARHAARRLRLELECETRRLVATRGRRWADPRIRPGVSVGGASRRDRRGSEDPSRRKAAPTFSVSSAGSMGNLPLMKSAYELAMERLDKSDPSARTPLTAEKKARLAEIDRVYKGKLAEREIFLQKQLEEALSAQKFEDVEKIRVQLNSEKARFDEDREAEKERVRRGK
jgi:ComEC/Rec2-related protein